MQNLVRVFNFKTTTYRGVIRILLLEGSLVVLT